MFRIEFQEYDSTPWSDGVLYSRTGAWKRVRMAARNLVSDWPYPVFVRIYNDASGVLVYACDLRDVKP